MANKKNLAVAELKNDITNSATSFDVKTGQGARLPATPFFATLSPLGVLSTPDNSEIISVTGVSTDTLTVSRAQKGTTALPFVANSILANGIYKEDLDDYQPLDAELTALAGLTSANNKIPYFTGSGSASLLTRDTDTALAGNSDANLATQKAVKAYIDAAILASTPPGVIDNYAGRTAPSGWFLCDGSTKSRTTYSALFATIAPTIGTFTVTIATPAVVTSTGHGLLTGDMVYLTTTGALPTGLTANTIYYVVYIDANTFNLATSLSNAIAGTKIATSGSQSGTHTLTFCPFGLGDGSTTFTIPDLRGRVLAGADAMGGTAASRLTLSKTTGVYGRLGSSGGAQDHQLVIAETPNHSVTLSHHGDEGGSIVRQFSAGNGSSSYISAPGSYRAPPGATGGASSLQSPTASWGSDGTHNNVQPTLVTNYIIKY